MAGNKAGALKARDTNIQNHGSDFYKKIGSKSWTNPERSRKTGFALDPALAVEAGRRGGKKTKNEYKTDKRLTEPVNIYESFPAREGYTVDPDTEEEWTTVDDLKELIEPEDISAGGSE